MVLDTPGVAGLLVLNFNYDLWGAAKLCRLLAQGNNNVVFYLCRSFHMNI